MKSLAAIVFGIALTVFGLAGGYVLGGRTAPAAAGAPAAKAAEAEGTAAPCGIAPQTLAAMGVEVGRAVRRPFVVTRPVQAVIRDRPLNVRPLSAPLGGIVVEVHVEPGQVVREGDAVVTLARDPIPRPRPELTADILAPLNEGVHESASRLRVAGGQADLIERELARIRPFVENQTLPRKTEIDLAYELERVRLEIENARAELRLHGLTVEETTSVEAGGRPPANRSLWKRALEQSGLWTSEAEGIYEVLTQAGCSCDLPWCVAAIGELSATGLMTGELLRVLKEEPAAAMHFADVAGLLLAGTPLTTVRLLAEQGALDPRVELTAPATGPEGWDVEDVSVRPGQRVEAGADLVRLHDARRMWLELEPIGQEIGLALHALEQGTVLAARPLVPGSGPDLEGVRLQRLATRGEEAGRGGRAFAEVQNEPVVGAPDALVRSWRLRVGLRYLVAVPVQVLAQGFVLPLGAVTKQGPDQVVFLQDGAGFRAQPVQVRHADDAFVVVADDGSLFEGDPVVVAGAFGLGLALGTGSARPDAHAGCNH